MEITQEGEGKGIALAQGTVKAREEQTRGAGQNVRGCDGEHHVIADDLGRAEHPEYVVERQAHQHHRSRLEALQAQQLHMQASRS